VNTKNFGISEYQKTKFFQETCILGLWFSCESFRKVFFLRKRSETSSRRVFGEKTNYPI